MGYPLVCETWGTGESCPTAGEGCGGAGRAVGASRQEAPGKSKDPDPLDGECAQGETLGGLYCVCVVCVHVGMSVPPAPGAAGLGVTYPSASNQRDRIQGPKPNAFPLVAFHPDQPRENRMKLLVQFVSATRPLVLIRTPSRAHTRALSVFVSTSNTLPASLLFQLGDCRRGSLSSAPAL